MSDDDKEIGLFDYVNSINNKNYIFNEETYNKKNYAQYVINTAFSYFPDTVLYANEMNKYKVSDRQHYDFLYHTIRKYKRFSKWHKKPKEEELKLISDYYNVSLREAKEMRTILTDYEMEKIAMSKGGEVK